MQFIWSLCVLIFDAGFGGRSVCPARQYQLDEGPAILAWPSLGLMWSPELELSYLAQAPTGEPAQDLLAPGLEWRLEFSAFVNLYIPLDVPWSSGEANSMAG